MSAPALTRQSTSSLEAALDAKLAEADQIRAAIAAKEEETGDKRAAPEDETEQKEEGAEPAAKKAQEESEDAGSDMETEDEEESADDEAGDEVLANGTNVAVAYGNLDGQSKRKWYAATIARHDSASGLYTVTWKYPPRGRKKEFDVDPFRIREVTQEDFDNAPKRGNHMCLHRASTFVAPGDEAEEEASEEEPEESMVGAKVAVAYGTARANMAGKDPTKGKNPRKYKKRYLWYAATVIEEDGDDVVVEWKYPVSHKTATFRCAKDKVQTITKREYKNARKASRGRKTYGLVGVHRVATKANLTVG